MPKIYLETTIVSYLADRPSRDLIVAAHQQITQDWWDNRRAGFDLFISQLVIAEAGGGDEEAARRRLSIVEGIPLLALNQDAVVLARALIEEGALPATAVEDALHIAVATVHGMDYLLSWNCKHIVNAEMRTPVVRISRSRGYEPPVICTPEELVGG